jgi:hypothetical protein
MNKSQKSILESDLAETRIDLVSVISDLAEIGWYASNIPVLSKALETLSNLEYAVAHVEPDPEPVNPTTDYAFKSGYEEEEHVKTPNYTKAELELANKIMGDPRITSVLVESFVESLRSRED